MTGALFAAGAVAASAGQVLHSTVAGDEDVKIYVGRKLRGAVRGSGPEGFRGSSDGKTFVMSSPRPGTYVGGILAKSDLVDAAGACNHALDGVIAAAYASCQHEMDEDAAYFSYARHDLMSADGNKLYIRMKPGGTCVVTDAFYRFLTSLESWGFAGGRFDAAMRSTLNGR